MSGNNIFNRHKYRSLFVKRKQKFNMKLPDAIIAGTAQFLNIPLLTSDKDFNKIEQLNLQMFDI